ncbi:MAG: glycosyltransferase [Actinomycetaceae bacterium]|nr:glycosyltransferase [Actinomycetaceae bacterium]
MAEPTVSAVIVTRGNTPYLEHTLAGVQRQKRLPNRLTVINVGDELDITGAAVIHIPGADTLGDAIRTAIQADDRILAADWLWILHDDSAPASGCLDAQLTAGEEGRTVGIVGPKQVAWSNPHRLIEVGIHATQSGRRMELLTPTEIDQGQHDNIADVLAVGTAGMLIRTDVWAETNGPDPVLGPFGDGLELCRRARLAGHRVILAPAARLAHARASYRDIRDSEDPNISRSFGRRRLAQLYNGALAASFAQLIVSLILLPFLTLGRAAVRILSKRVDLAVAELTAGFALYTRLGKIARGRRRIARQQRVPTSALKSLEATHREVSATKRALAKRERVPKAIDTIEPVAARLLRAHRTRSHIALLTGAIVTTILSVAIGNRLWGGIVGPAWVNLPDTYSELWDQAWNGWVIGGIGYPSPAEPLLGVFTILTAPFALLGLSPNAVLLTLWVLAPALVWTSMYLGAGALTHRNGWKLIFATLWLAAPPFLDAFSQGRLAGVLVHLFLPLLMLGWLRACKRVPSLPIRGAERSETSVELTTMTAVWAALAALSALVITAAAPWTIFALVAIAIILTIASPGHRVTAALTLTPALAFLIPLWIEFFSQPGARKLRLLLADSGQPYEFLAAPPWQTILGQTTQLEVLPLRQWQDLVHYAPLTVGAISLFGASVALVNTGSYVLRTRIAYLSAIGGFTVAIVSARTAIHFDHGFVAAWPGPALSISLIALLVAWSGGLGTLVLEESVRSYAARRRLEKLAKQRNKARRNRGEESPSVTHPQKVVASVDIETGRQTTSAAGTTISERILHPTRQIIAVLAFILPASTIALWAPTATYTEATITTAPAHFTPAAAMEAQTSDRHARLLRITIDGDTVTAGLYRGDGRQLADSSAVTRLALAVDVQYSQIDHRYDYLTATDPALSELALLVTRLLYTPETDMSEQLLAFAVDQIILTDADSARYVEAKAALDRNPALQRAGTSDTGLLWRVDTLPASTARLMLLNNSHLTALPSGRVGATVNLDNLDITTGTLVLAERANPDWRATVDGDELARTTVGWRQAFELSETSGTLRIRYQPDWIFLWWIASAVTFAGMVIAALPIRRRERDDDL